MIKRCDMCGMEWKHEHGAIMFGPEGDYNVSRRYKLCCDCFKIIRRMFWIKETEETREIIFDNDDTHINHIS